MKFLKNIIRWVEKILYNNVGIDLGTSNTLIYVEGKGIIYNEPSLVALNKKTGKLVAIGGKAREMYGKTPQHIKLVQPLVDGVISDFEITEELMRHLVRIIQRNSPKLLGPRLVIGVPSQITNVERRAVRITAKNAGAHSVYIIPEPIAAAIGIGVPTESIRGQMVVDIGGGTSDVMVISMGGVINAYNLRIAGNKLDEAIIDYIRENFKLLVGPKSAEELKKSSNPLTPLYEQVKFSIRGRNIITGLPSQVTVTDENVSRAIEHLIDRIIDAIREVFETTPPEIASDLYNNGLYLVGGGALLKGIGDAIEKELKIKVTIPDEPLLAVVQGAGRISQDIRTYESLLIPDDEQFNPELNV